VIKSFVTYKLLEGAAPRTLEIKRDELLSHTECGGARKPSFGEPSWLEINWSGSSKYSSVALKM